MIVKIVKTQNAYDIIDTETDKRIDSYRAYKFCVQVCEDHGWIIDGGEKK